MALYIDIYVDPHDAIPDGASLRYKAENTPQTVRQVRYESDDGLDGVWTISSRADDGQESSAYWVTVEDSGAGTSALVYGGDHGLRLRHEQDGSEVAEAYLLLDPRDILTDSSTFVATPNSQSGVDA